MTREGKSKLRVVLILLSLSTTWTVTTIVMEHVLGVEGHGAYFSVGALLGAFATIAFTISDIFRPKSRTIIIQMAKKAAREELKQELREAMGLPLDGKWVSGAGAGDALKAYFKVQTVIRRNP